VDDVPFGGGPGMVMKPDVWGAALDEIVPDSFMPEGSGVSGRLVVPTPSGVPFTQATAARYAGEDRLIFTCGRYEGIDARVVDHMRQCMPVDEVSIGDYVLAGGEAAVLVMIETVGRLLPGVLGNASSVADDSFGGVGNGGDAALGRSALSRSDLDRSGLGRSALGRSMSGLLEGPVYTRPRVWRGHEVPGVLLSGNHAAIARWRRDMALRRTAANRPDLIAALDLDARDRQVLAEAED
jgi:tRNA (guanine37-N1)-methyltransferase